MKPVLENIDMEFLPRDSTTNKLLFQPTIYPQCPTCKMPYVLRRSDVLRGHGGWENEWIFQRDCKHRVVPEMKGTAVKGTEP